MPLIASRDTVLVRYRSRLRCLGGSVGRTCTGPARPRAPPTAGSLGLLLVGRVACQCSGVACEWRGRGEEGAAEQW